VVFQGANIPRSLRALAHSLGSALFLALLTGVAFYLQANQLTIGLLYLLVVVAVAYSCGFWQASIAAVLAGLLLDYFFEPPIFSFAVASPAMFVALATFEVTALAISRLQGREMRVAREAALHHTGMEQLYELSRNTMLLDVRRPPGPQLAVLIQRIFGLRAVALFDSRLGRQDTVGDWETDEEDLAKQCYMRGMSQDNHFTHTTERILKSGSRSVGAMVIRNRPSALVVDALAALAALAIDLHQALENETRAEASRQSEALRSAVLDGLAHEFKTPLTAIHTVSSGLLELGGLTASQTHMVTLIDDETNRLNELCTRMLKTARLEPVLVGLETSDVNLLELISEVLATLAVDEKRNTVQVSVDEVASTVHVDRGLLGMILAQYIDNARKYSASGTPITIAARMTRSEVLISVQNFGSSIRIDDREQIFERFYRASDMNGSVPGTGIGLPVAKKAAEAHHGHVWAISDEKEGTTFYLSLPNEVWRTT
jgi:two-component system, OmpR family, sensor histidine kinase KdpD